MRNLLIVLSIVLMASIAYAWPHAIKPGGGGGGPAPSAGDPVLVEGADVDALLGIDLQAGSNGIDFTFNGGANPETLLFLFDTTEVEDVTWGNSTQTSIDWTFNTDTGTDPVINWTGTQMTFNGNILLDDGVTDSPAFSMTNAGNVSWQLLNSDATDNLIIQVSSALTEQLVIRNTGAGVAELSADGGLIAGGNAASAGFLDLLEDSDNGTNRIRFIAPASTADRTCTFTDAVAFIPASCVAGAAGGDTVQENTTDRVDFDFTDSAHIEWASTAASPSIMTALVVADALDFTEFADTMSIEPGVADPGIQTINIGDNERFLFSAVDTGTDGAQNNPFRIELQWDENVTSGDNNLGVLIESTNDNTFADSGSTTVMQIATIATANNAQYVNILHLDHRENLADTLVAALSITGNTANSMDFAIDISGASATEGINMGLIALYSSGDLSIGDATDTDSIVFNSDGSGFVRIDGALITGNLAGNLTAFSTLTSATTDAAAAGSLRLANIDTINWEADPVGTDVTLGVSAAEQLQVTSSIAGIGLVTTTATECMNLYPDTNAGVTIGSVVGSNFEYRGAAFGDLDNVAFFTFEVPDNFVAASAADVRVSWGSDDAACDGGASADVCWTLDGDSFGNDAAFTTGSLGGTLVSVTDNCTSDALMLVSLPAFTHSMVAGDVGILAIGRDSDGTDGAGCNAAGDDDLAATADLVSVRFCYEANNVFSGE